MAEDHFGEAVAARYDESAADMFEPAVVEPVVDFLVDLAGDGAALEFGGTLSVVYVVFNTIMNLTTQDEQVTCLGRRPRISNRVDASWSRSASRAAAAPAR